MKTSQSKPFRVAFLLLDNFTMISLAAAIDPLRMANQLSGEILYDWLTVSEDGSPVRASDCLTITPDCSMSNFQSADAVIVAGGVNIGQSITKAQTDWLRHLSRKGYIMGSICTGAYALAQAGLLNGVTCSTHWEYLSPLQEDFPLINSSEQLFSIDGKRMTASGGTAPMDMMLHMIGENYGAQLAVAIADMFVQERIRSEIDQQKSLVRNALGTSQPNLIKAVDLMEKNIEDPMTMVEIASEVQLSRRQLERLFKKYLKCTPSSFYLDLRLQRARQLLTQTSLPVLDVAVVCGFSSTSHFSKVYQSRMGVSPSGQRRGLYQRVSNNAGASVEKHHRQNTPDRDTSDCIIAETSLEHAQSEPTFASIELGN